MRLIHLRFWTAFAGVGIALLIAPPVQARPSDQSPVDWAYVQRIESGTDVRVALAGGNTAAGPLLFVSDRQLLLLAGGQAALAPEVRRALIGVGARWASVLEGYATTIDRVRVSRDGIFDGERQVATFDQVVRQIPREQITAVELVAGDSARMTRVAPVSSFEQLPTRLRVGDKVLVIDTAGRELKGRVSDLTPALLALGSGDGRRELPAASVRSVTWRQPDSLANGALIGLGVGLVLPTVAVIACSADSSCHVDSAAGVVVMFAAYAGIGAAIGTGIDALIPGKQVLVYSASAPPRATRISIAPILSPKRQGVAVRIVF